MKSNPLRLIGIQAALVVLAILFWPKDPAHQTGLYIFYGSLISGTQFGLLYFVWWRIFTKKKIAPSVFAVVIKYALLGLALWSLQPLVWSEKSALTIGVLTNPVAIIIFALTKKSK